MEAEKSVWWYLNNDAIEMSVGGTNKKFHEKNSKAQQDLHTKFRRIGVPTRYSFSRRILKVCNLGQVEARYWKPKIVFSRSTNTSLVRPCSNINVHAWLLIRVKTFFHQNASSFMFLSKFCQNTNNDLSSRSKFYFIFYE